MLVISNATFADILNDGYWQGSSYGAGGSTAGWWSWSAPGAFANAGDSYAWAYGEGWYSVWTTEWSNVLTGSCEVYAWAEAHVDHRG